jgi:hypothetical protein
MDSQSTGGGGEGGGFKQITAGDDASQSGPKITLAELLSLTRHSKFSYIQEALDYLPDKPFDKALVKVRDKCVYNTVPFINHPLFALGSIRGRQRHVVYRWL